MEMSKEEKAVYPDVMRRRRLRGADGAAGRASGNTGGRFL